MLLLLLLLSAQTVIFAVIAKDYLYYCTLHLSSVFFNFTGPLQKHMQAGQLWYTEDNWTLDSMGAT